MSGRAARRLRKFVVRAPDPRHPQGPVVAGAGRDGTSARLGAAMACCALTAFPFLAVKYAPIVDMPQQAAQIRLFLEALSPPHSYAIQWLSPNLLAYVVLGGCWALFPPEAVGRLAMLAIAILWVGALHWLGAQRQRPIESAGLASILVFNHTLYWGFYNFVLGTPIFIAWFLLLSRDPRSAISRGEFILLCVTALLLYAAHVLWLAAGIVWLIVRLIQSRPPLRPTLVRLASVFPVIVLAAFWYPHLTAAGFTKETNWGVPPWQRLSPGWLANAGLGGLRGPIEPIIMSGLALWMLFGVWQNRKKLVVATDRSTLLVAGLFLASSFALPHVYNLTIEFAERWFPVGFALLILSLPSPRIGSSAARRWIGVALFGGFCLFTSARWIEVDRNEFSGLSDAIHALPRSPMVLGLDYTLVDPVLKVDRPFLQTFAFAQVVKGGTLNFSFADRASSLVVYLPPRTIPWTDGLDWYPDHLKDSDLAYFSHVIVGGSPSMHGTIAASGKVRTITQTGVWRLYEVAR